MDKEPSGEDRDARAMLIAHEDATRAHAALAELSPALREAVVVYYHGDESMAAVAAALGVSVAAAKQRVHRGREQLREQLSPVESHLRRARPDAAFTAACIALWLSRGTAQAAGTGSVMFGLATVKVGLGVLAAAGGLATAATIDTRPQAPLERLQDNIRDPRLPTLLSATQLSAAETGPNALFGMRSEGGTLRMFTTFVEGTLNMPLRVADGFDPVVSIDAHERPLLEVIDGVLAQVDAKRTEITGVRILQQGGSADAAALGGDVVSLHYYDTPLFDVMRELEPHLHMPIFRDARAGQAPGPSMIGDQFYFRNFDTGELELVPHVTIDLENVTAGVALGKVLEQTGLGYMRTTGYLIEPR